jgi:hypothetical protein
VFLFIPHITLKAMATTTDEDINIDNFLISLRYPPQPPITTSSPSPFSSLFLSLWPLPTHSFTQLESTVGGAVSSFVREKINEIFGAFSPSGFVL